MVERIEELKFHIKMQLENYPTIMRFKSEMDPFVRDTGHKFTDLNDKHDFHVDTLALMRKQVDSLLYDMDKAQDGIALRAKNTDIRAIKEEFQRFALYDDYKKLFDIVMPSIAKFDERIQSYKTFHNETRDIIYNFDKLLTSKASLNHVENIEQFIEENMPSKKENE